MKKLFLLLMLPVTLLAQNRINLTTRTNGVLRAPTNFFVANSNLLSQAISSSGSGGASITNGPILISTNLLVTAVASATIGGTNVFEVVNQDTNKVFQVGTNGLTTIKDTEIYPHTFDRLGINGTWGVNNDYQVHNGASGNPFDSGRISMWGANQLGMILPSNWSYSFSSLDSVSSSDHYNTQDTIIQRSSAGTFLFSTNLIARGTITATNGLAVSTNYVAANMTPVQGLIKLVGSNNVLFIVTTTTTNQIP